VTLESTILVADVYTSKAIVDVYDEIIETDESDNTDTETIDVQPRETTILLENLKIDVVNSKGDCEVVDGDVFDCDGEWGGGFAVIDPAAADSYQLDDFYNSGVENDTVIHGGPFQVTLVESFPLILGAVAVEADVTSDPEFLGFALALWSSKDYLNVGSRTLAGQEGVCSGGRCFDLKYTVSITKKPAPPYLSTDVGDTGLELPPPELQILPPDLSELIPEDAELPEGVVRASVPWDTGELTDPLTGSVDPAYIIYLSLVQR
jgi:hypothetical protein